MENFKLKRHGSDRRGAFTKDPKTGLNFDFNYDYNTPFGKIEDDRDATRGGFYTFNFEDKKPEEPNRQVSTAIMIFYGLHYGALPSEAEHEQLEDSYAAFRKEFRKEKEKEKHSSHKPHNVHDHYAETPHQSASHPHSERHHSDKSHSHHQSSHHSKKPIF